MAIFSVVLLLVTPILLIAALAVRHAGSARVLNSIDYSNVTDPAGLNRWAGNRLLLLPLLSLASGALSLGRPVLAIVGGGVVMLAAVLVVIWIGVGSEGFRAAR